MQKTVTLEALRLQPFTLIIPALPSGIKLLVGGHGIICAACITGPQFSNDTGEIELKIMEKVVTFFHK